MNKATKKRILIVTYRMLERTTMSFATAATFNLESAIIIIKLQAKLNRSEWGQKNGDTMNRNAVHVFGVTVNKASLTWGSDLEKNQ